MFTKAVVVPGETRTGHWVPLQPVAAHANPRQPMPAHASSPPHRSQRHSAQKNHVALPCTAQAPPRCRSVLPTLYPPAVLPAQPHCSLAVAPRCHVNNQVAPSMSCLCMVVLARQTHPRAMASVQPSQNLAEQQRERRDRSSLSRSMFVHLQTSVCQQAEDGRCTHMWARPSPGRLGVRTLPRSIDQRLDANQQDPCFMLCPSPRHDSSPRLKHGNEQWR
jgi:hypothetical protein